MIQPGRKYSVDTYRYGFNGKENDNEVKGEGNQQDYGMRIYDPRLGRFLSADPLSKEYAYYTPYQFAGNIPVMAIDIDGGEPKSMIDENGKLTKVMISLLKAAFNYDEQQLKQTTWIIDEDVSEDVGAQVDPVANDKIVRMNADDAKQYSKESRTAKLEFLLLIPHEQKHVEQTELYSKKSSWDKYWYRMAYRFGNLKRTLESEAQKTEELADFIMMNYSHFSDILGTDDRAIEYQEKLGKYIGLHFQIKQLNLQIWNESFIATAQEKYDKEHKTNLAQNMKLREHIKDLETKMASLKQEAAETAKGLEAKDIKPITTF